MVFVVIAKYDGLSNMPNEATKKTTHPEETAPTVSSAIMGNNKNKKKAGTYE